VTDELRDQAAAEALGALPPDESEQLRAELERDPAIAIELEEYRSTVSMLEAGVAREAPSYDLFPGILAEIQSETRSAQVARAPRAGWS